MNQLHFKKSIIVKRSLAEAFHYISHFENCDQWDSSVKESRKISSGRVGVGTRFEIIFGFGPFMGPILYEVKKYDENNHLWLYGKGSSYEGEDKISFLKIDESSTQINYEIDLEFKGFFKVFSNSLKDFIFRFGDRALEDLKRALEVVPPGPKATFLDSMKDALILPSILNFTKRGHKTGKKRWNPISTYLGGKKVLLTGGNSGLGRATALGLAKLGADVTIVSRNEKKNSETAFLVEEETGHRVQVETRDLSLLEEVKDLSQKLLKDGDPIDILINNAGALYNERVVTSEGLEKSFALLLLSPFVLTQNLLPLLKKNSYSRVINVSSGGMYTQGLKLKGLEMREENYNGSVAYARAKRGLVTLSEIWSKEWSPDSINVNSMHPGWADTPGVANSLPNFHKLLESQLRTPEEGADTIIWMASAPELDQTSGHFFLDRVPRSTVLFPGTRPSKDLTKKFYDYLKEKARPYLLES
ncbi:SDR family NAD(P)-dependent oxidoreductase [Bacteriovoracales bacterium]|nr:SDR family NAD(P)-dependent oxidoreductase [Bacteriovoracales bacterium]